MKRLLTYIAGLVTLTTSGCVISLLTPTPKDVIHQNVACPTEDNAKAASFQIISTHLWSQGVVVLYSALCPGNGVKSAMKPVFGHKVVKHNGMGWQISGSDSYRTENYSTDNSSNPEKLIEYGISRSLNQNDRYAILYGRVLKQNVTAVEATFDNGQVLRDESSNGVFALISPGAVGVCELRMLGADNQILKQENLALPKSYLQHQPGASECLPVTHTL